MTVGCTAAMRVYEPRTYRHQMQAEDLIAFQVAVEETDLHIQACGVEGEVDPAAVCGWRRVALAAIHEARQAIRTEISLRPEFLTSLEPLSPRTGSVGMVMGMYEAAARAGVGPMAAVAGAVAEHVGRQLLGVCRDVVVENGGDVYLTRGRPRRLGVQAGRSPLSGRIAVRLPAGQPLGACTSSGTVGHSLSLGKADAALVIADSAAFADAMATALGNRVQCEADAGPAVEWAMGVTGVRQALVIVGSCMSVAGEFELERV